MAGAEVAEMMLQPPAGARVIDTGAARFWVEPDGIVCNQSYVDGVSAEQLRRGFAAMLELTGGSKAALLAEAGPLSSASREARDVLAGPEGAAAMAALGVIVRSPVARVIMNFFVRLTTPAYPVRVFTSVVEARAWARQFASGEAPPRGGV